MENKNNRYKFNYVLIRQLIQQFAVKRITAVSGFLRSSSSPQTKIIYTIQFNKALTFYIFYI